VLRTGIACPVALFLEHFASSAFHLTYARFGFALHAFLLHPRKFTFLQRALFLPM
jgi:hypothetical protein